MFKLFKKKKQRKNQGKIKVEVEKAGGIKIPPGFDAHLMKKLMKAGYKTGSLSKLEAHLSKKEIEIAKKNRKKHKKKRKPGMTKAERTKKFWEKPQGNPEAPVEELMPIEAGTEQESSVGILYGESKKPLDLSKLPKPKEDKK